MRVFRLFDPGYIGMLSAGIGGVGFFAAAHLVASHLDVREQSRYFMVVSLLALQSAFDLGASQLLMSNIAYRNGRESVDSEASTELISVLRVAVRYACICSVSYVPFFFSIYIIALGESVRIFDEGFLLALGGGLSLLIGFFSYFIEGLGSIRKAYGSRFLMNLIRILVLLAGLFLGLGVRALSISLCISAMIGLLVFAFGNDFRSLWSYVSRSVDHSSSERFSWRKDVFPSQWRMAISWISSYIIYQGPVWLSFYRLSVEDSAKFGLSWSIFMGLSSMGAPILSAQAARLSVLLGSGKISEGRDLWITRSTLLLGFSLLTGLVFIITVEYFPPNWLPRERVMDFSGLSLLLLASLVNQVIYCMVVWGRSGGEEVFHRSYLLWAGLMMVLYLIFSRRAVSPDFLVLGCFVVNVFMIPFFFVSKKNVEFR